jgi:hypothetical protein
LLAEYGIILPLHLSEVGSAVPWPGRHSDIHPGADR